MTKFTNPIEINAAGKKVVFDGVDFTENARITVVNASTVEIKNCRVYGVKADGNNKYWLNIRGDITTKLTVERNFFGANIGIYNLMELTCKLMDASSITSNYFVDSACTHNPIGMYGADNGATINVNKNVFETSKEGGFRAGMKGAAECIIYVNNNKINAKSATGSEDWEGILCIQPYGKATTDMSKITVRLNHNKIPTEQKVYGYSGENDMALTKDNRPAVFIDGKQVDYPIYH